MLELCKEILLKVSFDKLLFQKELNKAITWITNSDEKESLKTWCFSKFGKEYKEVINLAFLTKK
jgi:hypothetical protein